MRYLVSALIISFITLQASAEYLCFKNQTEYDAVKSKLPKILQEIPIYIVAEKAKVLFKTVSVMGYLQFTAGSTRFYFNATSGLDEPIDGPVNVCADDSEIKFTFPNKTKEIVKIQSDTTVSTRYNIQMEKVSKSDFARISNSLSSELPRKIGPSSDGRVQ